MKLRQIIIPILTLLIATNAGRTVAQNIITIAGNGTPAFTGDGGPATAAELNMPTGMVFDGAGNLYFADATNSVIRKITPAGIITTVAGNNTFGYSGDGGPATDAQLSSPTGLCIDAAGNMFIADYANQYVRKVTSSGVISTVAGNGTAGYNTDGVPATDASLNYPSSVAVDVSGNLYIADIYNHRVRKVTPAGIISTFAGTGIGTYSGDSGPATAAGIPQPQGVAVNSAGVVFIAEKGDGRIRKVFTTGFIYTHAGIGVNGYSGDGVAATNAQLNEPYSLSFDVSGNLYVADASNHRIRKIDLGGIISTIAGIGTPGYTGDGGAATAAELNRPGGVAIDGLGNVHIGDSYNNVIRKIVPNPALEVASVPAAGCVISVFPNPADAWTTLDIKGMTSNSAISVIDRSGRLMERRLLNQKNFKTLLDVHTYAAGDYLVMVVSGDKVYTQKLTVVR